MKTKRYEKDTTILISKDTRKMLRIASANCGKSVKDLVKQLVESYQELIKNFDERN